MNSLIRRTPDGSKQFFCFGYKLMKADVIQEIQVNQQNHGLRRTCCYVVLILSTESIFSIWSEQTEKKKVKPTVTWIKQKTSSPWKESGILFCVATWTIHDTLNWEIHDHRVFRGFCFKVFCFIFVTGDGWQNLLSTYSKGKASYNLQMSKLVRCSSVVY